MNYPYIDMHCDTLLRGFFKGEQAIYDGEGMQSIKKMTDAGQLAQFYAIFFPPSPKSDENTSVHPPLPEDREFFELLRNQLYSQVKKHSDMVAMAHNYDEIIKNMKAGISSAILTVEDGRMVDGKMKNLQYMYDKGVRAIALTWNSANCFGFPNSKDSEIMNKGLTDFGKEAIREMNRLGILVDVSHLSDGGFWDVAKLAKKPFIASHSNARTLTKHTRNLTDDMIRALAEKGGVAGINFGTEFIKRSPDTKFTKVEDLAAHVVHFISVGGEECVGLGTDFDGVEDTLEINGPEKMDLLFEELKRKGITERVLDKIASGNVLRVINDAMLIG